MQWKGRRQFGKCETIVVRPIGGWFRLGRRWFRGFRTNLQNRTDPPTRIFRRTRSLRQTSSNGESSREGGFVPEALLNRFEIDQCRRSGTNHYCCKVRYRPPEYAKHNIASSRPVFCSFIACGSILPSRTRSADRSDQAHSIQHSGCSVQRERKFLAFSKSLS
jgi:hypothetical protein